MGCSCRSASGARRLLAGRLDNTLSIAGVELELGAITAVMIGVLVDGLINNGLTL